MRARGTFTRGWAAIAALVLVGCGKENTPPEPAMSTDAAVAAPDDAGVRDLCPTDPSPQCRRTADCSMDRAPASSCRGCSAYNNSAICQLGRCVTPERLASSDPVNYVFQVGSLEQRLVSFSGTVLTAESAGGQVFTCDDVYAGRLEIVHECQNRLDTRGQDIARRDATYTMTFTQFPSGQLSLFVVYGYDDDLTSQDAPVGVSCKSVPMGPPGAGLMRISGDMMRPIK